MPKTRAKTGIAFPRRQAFAYNGRKRQVLAIFENRGWLTPSAVAVLAGVHPQRVIYSYLLRLHRWGLLDRRRNARGLLTYQLAAKGARRLAYLTSLS